MDKYLEKSREVTKRVSKIVYKPLKQLYLEFPVQFLQKCLHVNNKSEPISPVKSENLF